MTKKPTKDAAASQADKFIETARALAYDESEEAFDAKLKAIASVKPTTNEQVKKKTNKGKKNG